VVFVVVFYFYNRGVLEKSKKASINFYTKSGLMYLIDMRASENYNLYTINEIREIKPHLIHYSYENYIKYVNTHKAYKYSDWRLPSTDELLRLKLYNNWLLRPFVSDERIKHEINIDTKIFYDHRPRNIQTYWTGTECVQSDGDKGYEIISFNRRFYNFTSGYGKSTIYGGGGKVSVDCSSKNFDGNLRLVRDISFFDSIF
jgi:hypothetical protein